MQGIATHDKPRVLVACSDAALPVLTGALGESVEWVAVMSLEAALHALDAHPRAVVCSLRFDESRMLDLATEVVRRGDVRLVCCRVGESELPPGSVAAAVTAARNLGAVAFVDFARLREELGAEAALARLREEVLAAAA